jgi:predicted RNA-binding protein with PUA-like domain
MTDELLTLDDIAAMYKVSRWQARDNIVKAPGFPAYAPGTTWKKPRWLASEVRAFLRRRPAQIPHVDGNALILKAA